MFTRRPAAVRLRGVWTFHNYCTPWALDCSSNQTKKRRAQQNKLNKSEWQKSKISNFRLNSWYPLILSLLRVVKIIDPVCNCENGMFQCSLSPTHRYLCCPRVAVPVFNNWSFPHIPSLIIGILLHGNFIFSICQLFSAPTTSKDTESAPGNRDRRNAKRANWFREF